MFLFSDIYTKAIALFDDPKITLAYQTNKIQFFKLMYTYLQNAIALFTNPASIGTKLSNYEGPKGTMETFPSNGIDNVFTLSDEFILLPEDECIWCFIEGDTILNVKVKEVLNRENRTVTFPDILPEGQEYAVEQYFIGKFTESFNGLNNKTTIGNKLIEGEVKDILARLLVKAWAEGERNMLLDIRNLMQDSDFKITGNDRILNAKDKWIDQLDTEVLQLQNKLAWNIRFMSGSQKMGRG